MYLFIVKEIKEKKRNIKSRKIDKKKRNIKSRKIDKKKRKILMSKHIITSSLVYIR